jgi:SAM-dependent methyltransferase
MKHFSFLSLLTRDATYPVRVLLDRCIPSFVRDNAWFMKPFFRAGFGKEHMDLAMRFKDIAPDLSDEEMAALYRNLQGLSRHRNTDLNGACMRHILSRIDPSAISLLDVGCGAGAFLEGVRHLMGDEITLTGCDLQEGISLPAGTHVRGDVQALPFEDKSFDVVTCHHTLEHVKDLPRALRELRRVAKRQLIITVPCQEYRYLTVDLHLHFFPTEASLREQLGLHKADCRKLRGDWVCTETLS